MQAFWDTLTEEKIATPPREVALALLKWNDPNGSYDDAALAAEGEEPLTAEDARQLVLSQWEGR